MHPRVTAGIRIVGGQHRQAIAAGEGDSSPIAGRGVAKRILSRGCETMGDTGSGGGGIPVQDQFAGRG